MPKQAANILDTTGRKQGNCQVELLQFKGNKCGRCHHERLLKQRLYMSSKETLGVISREEKNLRIFVKTRILGLRCT